MSREDKDLLKRLGELDVSTAVPGCSLEQLNSRLVDTAILAQRMCGHPFHINCAYRSKEYDISKGRSGNSAHCKGFALDIATPDSHTRYLVLVGCVLAGFRRIGVGKRFLHVDLDDSKPNPIIFDYYE